MTIILEKELLNLLISILGNHTYHKARNVITDLVGSDSIAQDLTDAFREALKEEKNPGFRDYVSIYEKAAQRQVFAESLGEEFASLDDETIQDFIGRFKSLLYTKKNFARKQSLLQGEEILAMTKRMELRLNEFAEELPFLHSTITRLSSIDQDQLPTPEEAIQHWESFVSEEFGNITNLDLYQAEEFNVRRDALEDAFLRFLQDTPWHVFIKEKITEIISSLGAFDQSNEGLLKRLESIDSSGKYSSLLADVRAILRDRAWKSFLIKLGNEEEKRGILNSIKKNEALLQEEIENPSFGKVFEITGSSGSGKTHFLIQELGRLTKTKQVLPLYINAFKSPNESLEQLLASAFENALGFAQPLEGYLEFLSKHEAFANFKIVIALDEVEELDANQFQAMQKLISEYTAFPILYWVISLNFNFIDRFLHKDFSQFGYAYSQDSLKIEELSMDAGRKFRRQIQIPRTRWFYLDYINEFYQVSEKVLDFLMASKSPDESRGLVDFSKGLVTPGLAWKIGRISAIPKHVSSIQLGERISEETMAAANVTEKGMKEISSSICQVVLETQSYKFDGGNLRKRIEHWLSEHSFMGQNSARTLLEALLKVHLIDNLDYTLNIDGQRLILRNRLFWQYELAKAVTNSATDPNSLTTQIGRIPTDRAFWDGTRENILLHYGASDAGAGSIFESVSKRILLDTQWLPKRILWRSLPWFTDENTHQIAGFIKKKVLDPRERILSQSSSKDTHPKAAKAKSSRRNRRKKRSSKKARRR